MANDWPAVIREVLTRQAFLRLIADYYSLSEWPFLGVDPDRCNPFADVRKRP